MQRVAALLLIEFIRVLVALRRLRLVRPVL